MMRLVREGTLRDLLSHHQGPLSLEEALPLFVPLCDAVQYAHQEDIIHRDIKPQNVLLQLPHPCPCWLILASPVRPLRYPHDHDWHRASAAWNIWRRNRQEGKADARSDIYSLGIVLYQMLTGAMPYSGTVPMEVLVKKATDPAPDPRNFNPRLPAEIADILLMVLAKYPNSALSKRRSAGGSHSAGAITRRVSFTSLGQMIWQASTEAPIPPENDFATTMRRQRQPALETQQTRRSQGFGTLPTVPAAEAAEPTLRTTSQTPWSQRDDIRPHNAGNDTCAAP